MAKLQELTPITGFLRKKIQQKADAKAVNWLEAQAEKVQANDKPTLLFISFSQCSRHFSKDTLILSEADAQEASKIVHNWRPGNWDLLTVARAFLILHLPHTDPTKWLKTLDQLFETGDMNELEALYKTLPLYPHQERLAARASEGLRSNMTVVFDAVALNNPYPAAHLNETAWNQLVLKAIFLQRPLYQIIGLDERANPRLAETLLDAARERWAAQRSVMPELWRMVGPFIDEHNVDLVKKLLNQKNPLEVQAGVLACMSSKYPEAQSLIHDHATIKEEIDRGNISWESIGKAYVPFQ
jgi:hypothetical protein